ncbi:MAG: OmpA family protein [Rhodospirillales bacterium]
MGVIKEGVIQFQAGLHRGVTRSMPAVAVMAVLLTGCSSVPDAVNPAEWYKSTVDLFSGDKSAGDPEEEARRQREQQIAEAAGQEQSSKEFPKVSDVDKKQASRNLGLAADPDRPRYAPAITRQDQSAAADPVRPAAAPAAPPAPTPMAEKPAPEAPKAMADGPKLTQPKETLTRPAGEEQLATTVPGVPQFSVPTQAEQEAEFAGFQNRMQKRLAEILAAAGEEPRFVRPSGMPSGVGVGETMVISGDGVVEPGMTELPATVMESAAVAGTAQSQPLPAGATRVATIVFPNGSSRLSVRDRQILAQVVALQKERGGTLHVVGHSSSRTRNLSPEKHRLVNYKMSAERAKMVASELIRRGANRRTVATAALSDTQPLYQEIMPNGEAGNRRAEIFLTR